MSEAQALGSGSPANLFPAEPPGELDTPDGLYLRSRRDLKLRAWLEKDEQASGAPADPAAASAAPDPAAPADEAAGAEPAKSDPAKSAGRDVALGVMETPRQAFGGAVDAARELLQSADSLGNWIAETAGTSSPVLADMPNPLGLAAEALPAVDPARSVTGGIVRGVSQFVAGYAAVSKAFKGLGLAAEGDVGTAALAAVKGAMTDALAFDPAEKNLANLLKEHTELGGPVADYLATDPKDPEAINRLRNAVSGLVPGAALDGLVRGLRFVKAARMGRAAEDVGGSGGAGPDGFAKVPDAGAEIERDMLLLGDPNGPLLARRELAPTAKAGEDPAAKIADGGAAVDQEIGPLTVEDIEGIAGRQAMPGGETGGSGQVFINFARISAPEDVKNVIGMLADGFRKGVDGARRGVVADEQLKAMADDLGMTVGDVLARRQGQAMNAEETLASRTLWIASGQKVLEAARAVEAGATPSKLYAFRKTLAVHYAIQNEVLGARAEAGRALRAWSLPIAGGEGGQRLARDLDLLLDGMGGADASAALARRVATLTDPAAIAAVTRRGAMARTMGAVKEAYVMGLLWSPTTHIVNTMSNSAVIVQQIMERQAAAGVSAALRASGDGVAGGEAAAMTFGVIQSLREAFTLAGRALRTGDANVAPGGFATGKVDISGAERAISAEAFDIAGTPLGRVVDFVGAVNGVPGTLLGAEDAFFRTVGYRAEVYAQAARTASREGLKGTAYVRRIQEVVANPPEQIKLDAADAALYNTFTAKSGPVIEKLNHIRAFDETTIGGVKVGVVNPSFLIMPFLKTPANILKYSFERTPLAPMMAGFRADIAAGGARADIALARMGTGSATIMLAMDYATSGLVSGSGPEDGAEREALVRQGWQPYSIFRADGQGGGTWHSYQRADPIGMTLGIAADLAELYQRFEIAPEDVDEVTEVLGGLVGATAHNFAEKSYMQGVGRLFEVMSDPERFTGDYVNDLIGSFVPFNTALGFVARAMDPEAREVTSPMDAIAERIPGLRAKLAKRKDLWGEDVVPDRTYGRVFDTISPIKARSAKDSPIDAEFERLGFYPRRIGKKASIEGAVVNFADHPQAYERYQELAGHALKHPAYGVGAKDFLDTLVSGEGKGGEMARGMHPLYAAMPPARQQALIEGVVREYRELAGRQILNDPRFAALIESWGEQKMRDNQRQMPAGLPAPAVSIPPGLPDFGVSSTRRGGPAARGPMIP